jgi:HPt (histidine-containing phosphotransfer) domain-containing protein
MASRARRQAIIPWGRMVRHGMPWGRRGRVEKCGFEKRRRVRQAPPTLDFSHLVRQTAGDPALQREILALFVAQSAEILAPLRDAATLAPARADLAHKLRGSAQAVGAFALAQETEAAEAEFRAGRHGAAALERLSAAADVALAAIRSHLSALP